MATTLEAALLQLALSCYPSHRALGLAALSVMLRPTAALAWLPLAPLYMDEVYSFRCKLVPSDSPGDSGVR